MARLRALSDDTLVYCGHEKATNPFLRWDSPEIMRHTGETDPVRVFAAVRSLKDAWRG